MIIHDVCVCVCASNTNCLYFGQATETDSDAPLGLLLSLSTIYLLVCVDGILTPHFLCVFNLTLNTHSVRVDVIDIRVGSEYQ
jgi:hypothetical protein